MRRHQGRSTEWDWGASTQPLDGQLPLNELQLGWRECIQHNNSMTTDDVLKLVLKVIVKNLIYNSLHSTYVSMYFAFSSSLS